MGKVIPGKSRGFSDRKPSKLGLPTPPLEAKQTGFANSNPGVRSQQSSHTAAVTTTRCTYKIEDPSRGPGRVDLTVPDEGFGFEGNPKPEIQRDPSPQKGNRICGPPHRRAVRTYRGRPRVPELVGWKIVFPARLSREKSVQVRAGTIGPRASAERSVELDLGGGG